MSALARGLALWLGAAPLLLQAAELRCASAESMDGLMAAWTAGFNALHPESPARVARRSKYSADFVDALARGEVTVATFARELFPAERARSREIGGGEPRLIPVAMGSRATKGGTHAIVMFVNEHNPIARLSLSQLREIWAHDGGITTWGQVGLTGAWADRRITLHGMKTRRDTGNPPGIVNFLENRLLSGRAWRDDVREYSDAPGGAQALEQIVRAVAADETAIGYSGFAYAVPGVKSLELGETDAGPFNAGSAEEIAADEYPLTRMIYLAVEARPDNAAASFVNYALSPEGQRLIAADAQGFAPLPANVLRQARAGLAGDGVGWVDPALPAYVPRPVEFPRGASYVAADGSIVIVGYNDMAGMLTAINARFAAAHPGFRFTLRLKGTRTAPLALARGESAFAPMGAEFSPEQLQDYRAVTGEAPRRFRVAHCSLSSRALSGPLAIVVHRDNPLKSLTLAQVRRIFGGGPLRWKDVGGLGEWSGSAVHPIGLRAELALGIFLRERVGIGPTFGESFNGLAQSADVIQRVAEDRWAIGFAAINRITPAVRVLAIAQDDGNVPVAPTEDMIRAGRYPLDRYLLIHARQQVDPFVREYLRLVLSRDGQEAIAADSLGYIPLSAAEAAQELSRL